MTRRSKNVASSQQLKPLPISLAAALGMALTGASLAASSYDDSQPVRDALHSLVQAHATRTDLPVRKPGSKRATDHPTAPTTYHVNTCADDNSPQSLRTLIGSAQSGDTIDFTQIPMSCSTITLDAGQSPRYLQINQPDLYLAGPGAARLTIDASGGSAVINHLGGGTLHISDLTIAHGYYSSATNPTGGCIYSSSNVALTRSVISHCDVVGTGSAIAAGAGVYARDDLSLVDSTISNGHAVGVGGADARGGGVFVHGDLNTKNSTISDNSAAAFGANGTGAGATVLGGVSIYGSTFSGNHATVAGALDIEGTSPKTAAITNSTISENTASTSVGGIFIFSLPITVSNSTIAFNRTTNYETGAGIFLYTFASSMTLQSSIVANNGTPTRPGDVYANFSPNSSNNLIVRSWFTTPTGTVTACPQLEPLANNGGSTRTHALSHLSPALDAGNNFANLTQDQRGITRPYGVNVDIGAFEWNGGTDEQIFVDGFEGACDQ